MFQVWFTNYKTGQRLFLRLETLVALEELNRGEGVMARSAIYVVDRAEPWQVTESVEEIQAAINEFMSKAAAAQHNQMVLAGNRLNGARR